MSTTVRDLENHPAGGEAEREKRTEKLLDEVPTTATDGDSAIIGTPDEPVVLTMEIDDPENALNFSFSRKVYQTTVVTLMTMAAAFSSSIFGGSVPTFQHMYDLSFEVAISSVALFTLGFTIAPVVYGPLSEALGRQVLYWTAFLLFVLFHLMVGFAQNPATVLVGRFFEGIFGSVMLPLIVASSTDMWIPTHRAYVIAIGASIIFASTAFGPIVGSYAAVYLGWRWTSWLLCMLGGVLWVATLFMKETYSPVLLRRRAQRMRAEGHFVVAPIESNPITLSQVVSKYLVRPFVMLVTEPALLFVSVYTAIGYALLYAFLLAYNYVFMHIRGFSFTTATLPLLGVCIGVEIGALIICSFSPSYLRAFKRLGHPDPERRLHCMIPGAICLPIGLFLFAWTGPYPSIHWIVPSIAGVFMGIGMVSIFMSSMLFCGDCYGIYAASAVSANVMLRSLLATAFTWFTRPMIVGMGVQGSFSMLGGIGVVACAGPFLLIKYGKRLRMRSKWGMVYSGE